MIAERKADQERWAAERKAYEKKMIAERKADQERREAERNVDREVARRLEAIHDNTYLNKRSVELETEHQEKIYAWIADMENDRKETTSCQDAMEANIKKMEPIPGEVGAVVEWQEIPNEEVSILSLRACRKERTAC
jgi:hypothetical protein